MFPALCCKVWFLYRFIWKSKPNDKNLETKHSNAYYLISWDKKKVRLSTLSSWEQRLLVNKQPISIQDLLDCLPDNNSDNQSEFKKERLMDMCFIKKQNWSKLLWLLTSWKGLQNWRYYDNRYSFSWSFKWNQSRQDLWEPWCL